LAKSFFTPDVVVREKELANAYWEDTGDKALVFFGVCDGELSDSGCPAYRAFGVPYFNRFSPAYRKKVRKELWKYRKEFANYRKFLFMTLTIDPKRFNSQYEAKRVGERVWNALRTRIVKEFPWVKGIATREWQENGIGLHLHVLIAGLDFLDKSWVMETWKSMTESGWGVELKPLYNNVDGVLDYVFKYITKSVVNRSSDKIENVSAVVNWAVNGRAFSFFGRGNRLGSIKEQLQPSDGVEYGYGYDDDKPVCTYKWHFLGYVPYHVHEYGLTRDVNWVIEYFGLDKPPPYN
jgi:hypothetical protein